MRLFALILVCSTAQAQLLTSPALLTKTGSIGTTYSFAFDASSSSQGYPDDGPITWTTHVTAAQGNRAIYFAICYESSTVIVDSLKRGTQKAEMVGWQKDAGNECIAIMRLLNPGTGDSSTTAYLSGTPTANWKVGAWSFTGVNQTTPNGPWTWAENGYSTPTTVSVLTSVGEICIAVTCTDGNQGATSHSATNDWELYTGNVSWGNHATATGSTTTFTDNMTGPDSWAYAAIAIKPN